MNMEMQMEQEPKKRRQSFSVFDHQGDEIRGTLLAGHASALLLIQDADTDVVWVVDNLEEVGVSLDLEQAEWLVLHFSRWLTERGRAVNNHALIEALRTLRYHLQKQPDAVRFIDAALSAAQEPRS